MSDVLPLVAVLGDEPTPPLLRPLAGIARVEQSPGKPALRPDVVLLPCDETLLPLLEEIRSQAGGDGPPPVLVYTEDPSSQDLRQRWRESGALELVGREQVVEAVLRCLPGGSHSRGDLASAPLASVLSGSGRLERPGHVEMATIFRRGGRRATGAGRAPVPELPWEGSGPISTEGLQPVPQRYWRFMVALAEYFHARLSLEARLGPGSRKDIAGMLFQRTKAVAAMDGSSPSRFCPKPGKGEQPLDWEAELQGVDSLEHVRVLNMDVDSMCVGFKGDLDSSSPYSLRLVVEGGRAAEIWFRSRWRRRTGRHRWEMGASLEAVRVQDGPGS